MVVERTAVDPRPFRQIPDRNPVVVDLQTLNASCGSLSRSAVTQVLFLTVQGRSSLFCQTNFPFPDTRADAHAPCPDPADGTSIRSSFM